MTGDGISREQNLLFIPVEREKAMRAGHGIAAALLAVVLLATAATVSAASLRSGDRAPVFSLPDLAGRRLTVPDGVRGKVAIIHFWSSHCPFCRDEIRDLQDLSVTEKGVLPLSVNAGDARSAIDAFLTDLKPTYPILVDAGGKVARSWGVTGIPTTFIISRNGIIRYKILGEIDGRGLKKLIATIGD